MAMHTVHWKGVERHPEIVANFVPGSSRSDIPESQFVTVGERVEEGKGNANHYETIPRGHCTGWNDLPNEIRITILREIPRYSGWSSLASVCKQWQFVIEQKNFADLRLRKHHLEEFRRITRRRRSLRNLIRCIFLDVETLGRRCSYCSLFPIWTLRPISRVPYRIPEEIRGLLAILSSWEPGNDLTLDFGVCSADPLPSYVLHGRPLSPKCDWVSPESDHTPLLRRASVVTHAIMRREFDSNVCHKARMQILGNLCPSPHIVQSLIRLRSGQGPEAPSPWYEHQVEWHTAFRTLTVFQDSRPELFRNTRPRPTAEWESLSSMEWFLENCLRKSFRARVVHTGSDVGIEHIAISNMIDAEELILRFPRPSGWSPSWKLQKVKSLTLTSRVLRLPSSAATEGSEAISYHRDIDDLICKAGKLALQMPDLQSLAIWDGSELWVRGTEEVEQNACAFVYRKDEEERTAYITWRGVWNHEMSPEAVQAWRCVARTMPFGQLSATNEQIRRDCVKSQQSAIERLKLPYPVLLPKPVTGIA
ncbi:hypothetical protein F5Y15DRAFT_38322 [Xylariaceae sp. FL0016]|nr:hypothetical protein F5Y15DRAFT_38322 [Xylariaceae sp. FL0016]